MSSFNENDLFSTPTNMDDAVKPAYMDDAVKQELQEMRVRYNHVVRGARMIVIWTGALVATSDYVPGWLTFSVGMMMILFGLIFSDEPHQTKSS